MKKCGSSIIGLISVVLAISGSLLAKPKPAGNEITPASRDSTESPKYDGMFNLAGQAGLPSYLKCDQQMLGGGLRKG